MRHLSLSGVLQRRPAVICLTTTDALHAALSELCKASSRFDPTDTAAAFSALTSDISTYRPSTCPSMTSGTSRIDAESAMAEPLAGVEMGAAD